MFSRLSEISQYPKDNFESMVNTVIHIVIFLKQSHMVTELGLTAATGVVLCPGSINHLLQRGILQNPKQQGNNTERITESVSSHQKMTHKGKHAGFHLLGVQILTPLIRQSPGFLFSH